MNQAAAGSPVWQLVFVSFAVVLILFEILRGWRLGLMRQVVRIAAVISAYGAAYFGGDLVAPILGTIIKMPDIVLSILAGAILALLVYTVITGIGTILFKRTAQQNSGFVRFIYGITGALVGVLFGVFLVWLVVVGIRSVGTIADAQVRSRPAQPALAAPRVRPAPLRDDRLSKLTREAEGPDSIMTTLARLKNSLEMGSVGDAVKKTDVVPTKVYETLAKVGNVFTNSENAERFLSYPGARELSEHPKIVALREDSEIMSMIEQGRFFELIQDQRLIDAANDPTLVDGVKKFQLEQALDYATKRQ